MQASGPITHGEVRSLQDDTGGALGLPDLTHMPPFLRHSHSVHYLPTGRTKTNASCCCWSLLYNAILRSRADSMRSHVILHEWLALYSAFLNIHRSGVVTALAWLVPHETAAVSSHSVYTIQSCTMSLHAEPVACVALVILWAVAYTYKATNIKRKLNLSMNPNKH